MFDREPSHVEYKELIDAHLIQSGLNQTQFCKESELNGTTLSQMLNGKIKPSVQFLADLSGALGFRTVDDFKRSALDRNVFGFDAAGDCLTIGRQRTLWLRAAGNGRAGQELKSKNTECRVASTNKSIFTSELQKLLLPVERKFLSGEIEHEDKTVYAVKKLVTSPQDETGSKPLPIVKLDLVEVPYHAFWGLINDEPCKRYRRRILQTWLASDGAVPEISLGLGINVAVISQDNGFVIARRHQKKVGARPGEIDVGAVEGIRPEDIVDGKLDVERLAFRAVEEEYDIHQDSVREMHIIGIGYDLYYSQWNFLAVCYVSRDAATIEPRRKALAVDEYEYEKSGHLSVSPKEVFNFLAKQDRIWSCALATTFYALIHFHGSQHVLNEVEDFRMRHFQQYHVSRLL